jgi:hypothetical protein
MLCMLRRDPLKMMGLRGSNAPYFTAGREHVNTADEQFELILILLAISCAMQVGISWFKML